MAWADDHKIETPELVEVSLEIAGLGSRFVAKIYDWFVKWGILLVVSLLAVVLLALVGSFDALRSGSVLILALVVALYYFFLLGFDIYYEVRRNGQTPGKRLAGIRVIREGGGPVDFQSSCIRNLLALADFLPGFYLLGGLLVLLSPRGQRLGDMAAGTIVVRERALEPPVDLHAQLDEAVSSELVFSPEQLTACSPGDRHISTFISSNAIPTWNPMRAACLPSASPTPFKTNSTMSQSIPSNPRCFLPRCTATWKTGRGTGIRRGW